MRITFGSYEIAREGDGIVDVINMTSFESSGNVDSICSIGSTYSTHFDNGEKSHTITFAVERTFESFSTARSFMRRHCAEIDRMRQGEIRIYYDDGKMSVITDAVLTYELNIPESEGVCLKAEYIIECGRIDSFWDLLVNIDDILHLITINLDGQAVCPQTEAI